MDWLTTLFPVHVSEIENLDFQRLTICLHKTCNYPVDTGRKLNVLCTFNLRPVSTG